MKGRPADPARAKALESGLLTYQGTGVCRLGHVAPLRYASTAACVECVKARDKARAASLQPV